MIEWIAIATVCYQVVTGYAKCIDCTGEAKKIIEEQCVEQVVRRSTRSIEAGAGEKVYATPAWDCRKGGHYWEQFSWEHHDNPYTSVIDTTAQKCRNCGRKRRKVTEERLVEE